MKKEWVAPKVLVQRFVANDYVAACGDTAYGMYKFECDAPAGKLYYYNSDGRAQVLGNYHPCGATHEASVSSEFPDGFIDYNQNKKQDEGEAVIVWIQRDWFGSIYNAHATTNLNRDQWEITKS